jgi:DNA (cytosine-5)-methyltransferase 1
MDCADTASLIKQKRHLMGFTQKEFSEFLGLNEAGERTVRGWENGEHTPGPKRLKEILAIPNKTPFKMKGKNGWMQVVNAS